MSALLLSAMFAMASDPVFWAGGGGNVTAGVESGQVATEVQLEGDVRYEVGRLFLRADVDVTLAPLSDPIVTLMPPEVLMLQFSQGPARIRLGVKANNFGLEAWDPWNNYLPTWSLMYNAASPGRLLVGELAFELADGSEVYAYGGGDLDARFPLATAPGPLPTFGLGISAEKDMWSTWSAVVGYPTEGWYYAWISGEVYPLDALTVAVDGAVGIYGGAPYAGGQLVLNALPEAIVTPVVRGEIVLDPDDAALDLPGAGLARRAVSLGAKLQSHDWMTVMAEGRLSWYADGLSPGIFVMFAAFRPEPSGQTAVMDDLEEVEE